VDAAEGHAVLLHRHAGRRAWEVQPVHSIPVAPVSSQLTFTLMLPRPLSLCARSRYHRMH
jgi:hypothetical protein